MQFKSERRRVPHTLKTTMMILIIGLVAAAMLHSAQGDGCNRIVCYTTNWSQYRPGSGKFMPENIDPSLCTHMIYAFAKLSGNQLAAFEWNDDSTDWSVGLYQKFMNLKQKNPNVKTMLAVGGWNLGSAPFTQIVGSPGNRKAFITQAISFLRQRGFDGLDLDWEYPANRGSPPQDRQHFTELVTEIRQAFEEEGRSSGKGRLLLSAAVAAGKDNIDTAYDVPAVSKQVDFINLMTYDLHGSWETFTGHNSPLYACGDETGAQRNLNVDWAARYWVQKGAPKDKLNIGMGLYGRSFTLASASNHQPGAPAPRGGQAGEYTREAGFIAYYEVCDMIKKGATKEYIADQQVPYIHQDTQWVGYDDPDSLKKKVRYVKQNGFGGVMVWALPLDDFSGTHCNQGAFPLMHAINSECGHTSGDLPTAPPVNPVTSNPHQTTHAPATTAQSHPVERVDDGSCSNKADGFYASSRSCKDYIICAGGAAYSVHCAEGLVFNANSGICDWPANYHCTLGDAPVGHATTPGAVQQHTTRAPSGSVDIDNFCQGKTDGIQADPTDCAFFFDCANGRTFRESCAPGTVFNPAISNCDMPDAVPSCNHRA